MQIVEHAQNQDHVGMMISHRKVADIADMGFDDRRARCEGFGCARRMGGDEVEEDDFV